MLYLLTAFILILFYVGFIILMKHMKNIKLINSLLCVTIFLCYAFFVFVIYLDVGLYDWNFLNTMPTANVSPFMFFTLPLLLIEPKKIKTYHLTLISLLSAGMLLSTLVNIGSYFFREYKFHIHFLLDFISHILLSLYGIYLVYTNQVTLNKKNCLGGVIMIFSVVLLMIILNICFDTSFFGLSLNGKHNIYNNVIVDNSYLSMFIYIFGLSIVLLSSFVFTRLIKLKLK